MYWKVREPGVHVRRWIGVPTGTVASRLTHSSAAFAKQLSDEGRRAEGVPASSIVGRGVVVEWGASEKSRLCVVSCVACVWGADVDG